MLATTIANFAATVTICAHPAAEPSDAVVLLPHALFDGVSHARGWEELAAQVIFFIKKIKIKNKKTVLVPRRVC